MLTLGRKTLSVPILQGGMGVGISLDRLAGAMAACGGITAIAISATNYAKTLANQQVGDRDWLLALVALLLSLIPL